jgi:hypothetical protein
MLDEFGDWTTPKLEVLRAYALSCGRLETLQQGDDVRALHRELRANLNLLKALNLED